MPNAISDSSTLIHLAGIGQLGLLKALFGRVMVPPAVWREVAETFGLVKTGVVGVLLSAAGEDEGNGHG